MKDYVSPEDYPVAYVLNAAKEDGQAQDDLQASVREAVTFVLDLVEHSRAFDEVLPRGYSVHKVRGRRTKDKGVIKPRVELRHQPRSFFAPCKPLKIAARDEDELRLESLGHLKTFIKHIKQGLLVEIGEFFVERSRATRRHAQELQQSVEDVRIIRRLLERESSEDH